LGFNLSDLYEQTGLAFFTLTNFVITIVYVVLLFPSKLYKIFFNFLVSQVVQNGQMQSGNISVIFISILCASFLVTHLSNWADAVLPLFVKVDVKEFKFLIASAFWNISTLYIQNEEPKRKVFNETIQESVGSIFSMENRDSTQFRMLSGKQQRWRIYKNYSGTFKLVTWIAIFLCIIHLRSIGYYLILACSSALLWFITNILLYRLLWDMLYSYWYLQEGADIKNGTYLDKIWKRDYFKYSLVNMNRWQKKNRDIKNSWQLCWK